MGAFILLRLTFLESVRRRIAVAAFVLGIAFLVLYGVGFHYLHKEAPSPDSTQKILVRNQIFNFLSTAGRYAVNFLTVVMGTMISAGSLAGEISSGAIQTIASKPIRRSEIVIGKWLGFAFLLALYLMLMAGGVLGIVYLESGYHLRHITTGIGLIYLESLLVMTLSLACSTTFSTLATGGVVFGMYGLAFIGGWVEQIGAVFKNQTAVNIGVVSSLIFPSEVLWKRAGFEMSSPLIQSMGIAAGPFGTISVPSSIMIYYAAFYMMAVLVVSIRRFEIRDL